jgi:thiol:disulfide interchange protein DsbD
MLDRHFINPGLQPGVRRRTAFGAASAALTRWGKPLKRRWASAPFSTGLKPGVTDRRHQKGETSGLTFVRFVALIILVLCLSAKPAPAQPSFLGDGGQAGHHTQVKLLLSADSARPGDPVIAGVDLKMDPAWHTYWKNAGDSGSPTKITWTLPAGVSAGETQWPLPHKLPPAEVTTYGYEDEVVLLAPLTLATNLPPGPLDIFAKVSWLECKDTCIPASTVVAAKINVGSETKPSAEAATLQQWQARLPKSQGASVQAWWEPPVNNDTRSLNLAWADQTMAQSPDFFPDAGDNFEVQSATEQVPALATEGPGAIHLRKIVKKFAGDSPWPREVSGVLVGGTGESRAGLQIKVPIASEASVASVAIPASRSTASNAELPAPLWQMLLYAFLGGLILNLMPCVLPVIALKILGFVSEAGSSPRHVRVLGLVYALGVIASFLVLAGVVIGLQAAGHHPGWGMQFSSPVFVVCLATLVLLVAMNLFGVFEVTLGGGALDSASQLASRSGMGGAFFNGVLATTLATPCTAPFLAPALGFAFAQPGPVVALFFFTIGLGLAAPYLVLSWQPAWLKFLPKPGAWMQKFKVAMAFPMLATLVWLYTIATSSYGKNVLWLGLFLVLTALAAWVYGEFVQRGRRHQTLATIIALLLFLGGYGFALEKELDWRAPVMVSSGAGNLKESAQGIAWHPWSPEAVAAARAAGQPVLVDFTADWCLTCQANKYSSIEIPSVREKLKAINAVALIGDYTHTPDVITAELNRYHRAGVPLVLVYPKGPDAPAVILPAILTPGIVLSALDQAK